ncbi:MAG: SGNH/GDSL hydrolase family protein [Planctomycetaceae bacterium]
MLGRCFAFSILFLVFGPAVADDVAESSLRLTLPPTMNAVVGQEMGLYFDNIVLTQSPDELQFDVTCDIGTLSHNCWTVTPSADQVGLHEFTVSVSDSHGVQQGQGALTLQVVPADARAGESVTLLIVGDSLTHATVYPNELARLLGGQGNPDWSMLGSHRPDSATAGVAHEGYGGWTWHRFASHYEPNPDGTYKKRSSPFVFLGENGQPQLDVDRFFDEACDGERPDTVFFLLGINDCFGANPDDPIAMDVRIDAVLMHADTVLAAFHEAAPEAELAICLTPPPNTRESAFEANYKGAYHRWGWKRIQHRLVERMLEHFANREDEKQFLVPTELFIDPENGYPENNAVHPNEVGYHQLATSMYAWLKSR